MTGFLISVRAEPADATHCDDVASATGKRFDGHCCHLANLGCCPLHEGGLEVDEETGQWIRCPECVAAEKEARDEA